MLTRDEELRLAGFISSIREDVLNRREYADLTPKALLWLAVRAGELNEELAAVHEELRKTNVNFANYVDQHE